MTMQTYSSMTPAEQARIDQDEDRREARKSYFNDGLNGQRTKFAALRETAAARGCPKAQFESRCRGVSILPPCTPPEWVLAAELVVLSLSLPPSHPDDDACNPAYIN
jgi:hypothetical protein